MDEKSILFVFLGLLLGALVTYLFMLAKNRRLTDNLAGLQTEKRRLEERYFEEKARRLALEEAYQRQESQEGRSRAFLKEALADMDLRFRGLTDQVLEESRRRLLKEAQDRFGRQEKDQERAFGQRKKEMDDLLDPVQKSLSLVEGLLARLEADRIQSLASVSQQMKDMVGAQKDLRKETQQLVRALRRPQGRGRWGEVQLRRVVELAGMQRHCDFYEQVHLATEGGPLRPDMVISLPGNKQIVVDAKSPLEAYLEAVETDDEARRDVLLTRHAQQVKSHVQNLSNKAYYQQFEETPEFVVLFLPGESFFSAALEKMPDLIDYAMAKQVIVSTPTTLIALLKSAAFGWSQLEVAENAKEIAQLGQMLYDRLRVFSQHFQSLERSLDKTVGAYNRAVMSFDKRILPAVRRFEDCGLSGDKDFSQAQAIQASPAAFQLEEGEEIGGEEITGEGMPGEDMPKDRPEEDPDQ